MRIRSRTLCRPGASMVESAIVILVFLIFVLGMIDLGVGVTRYHIASQGARCAARQAIVHGEFCPAGYKGGQWGTTPLDCAADDTSHPIVNEVRPFLTGLDPTETRLVVEWPGDDGIAGNSDDSNRVGKPVRVRVTTPFRPMLTFLFGNPTFTLRASSTMPIAH